MTVEAKACELLCSGSIHIADFDRAVVTGAHGTYEVVRVGEQWCCDCKGFAFRGRCSHVEAVTRLTRWP